MKKKLNWLYVIFVIIVLILVVIISLKKVRENNNLIQDENSKIATWNFEVEVDY